MKSIITLKNVNFTYNKGKDNEFQALININLEIYPEEFIVVFGPSGCGKSTLLNVIAGLEKPDAGLIKVFERDLMALNARDFAMYHRSQVGMIYQAYNLITSLTVMDNVALPQIFLNISKHKREKWSLSLLKRFGIAKQAKKIPTELSGGQQQRIGIARAIVNNPQIVLADEPVGNLDSVSAKNVLTILDELNEKEKKTIILVTHNPENLEYADRIINMRDGLITGEMVNRDRRKREKKEFLSKTPSTEIQDLMRAYRGLSPEQINILIMPYKAKVFSNHFITSRNMEETKRLEEVIQRRLLGTISLEEFFEILRRPADEGGVGFNVQTAEKIVRRVNRIIRIAYFVYQKGRQKKNKEGGHDKITDKEKTEKMVIYLLNTCYHDYYEKLNEIQLNRLKKAVADRMKAAINKSEFYNYLDMPFKENGIGLNSKTARAMTEEMELILILGFGISQNKSDRFGTSAVSSESSSKEAVDTETKPDKDDDVDDEEQISLGELRPDNANDAAQRLTGIVTEEISGSDSGELSDVQRERTKAPDVSSGGKENDEEISRVISDAIVSMDVGGMKDFAEVMKKVRPKLKDKASEEKIAAAVEKAIIKKNK